MNGTTIDELDTPSLLLDLDAVERNLDRMAAFTAQTRAKLRPHTKTHKSATLARMQLARGAIGVCCAKIGEAEALCDGGIDDVLVTTEIVGRAKIARLIGLARRASVTVVVDSAAVALTLAHAAAAAGMRLRTLVDVNVGQNRAGVSPGQPAVDLGRLIAGLPGLELVGLQGYEGHVQHVADPIARAAAGADALALLADTAKAFATAGLATDIVTTGGTGTFAFAARHETVTDIQAGSYVVMDAQYGAVAGLEFEFALTLATTIISVRGRTAILDAGYKSLSDDGGPPKPLTGDAAFAFAGDEFGKLTADGDRIFAVGEVVRVIPGHCDTTINLHDEYVVHRGQTVVDRWPIVGRGKSR